MDPDFAGSGEAYLVGLGATDSPASLGTEVLEFTANNPEASPFKTRKQRPENIFSVAIPCEIEMEEEEKPGLFARIQELLGKKSTTDDAKLSDVHKAVEAVATAATEAQEETTRLRQEYSEFSNQLKAHHGRLDALEKRIDFTEAPTNQRPPATGGSGMAMTDC